MTTSPLPLVLRSSLLVSTTTAVFLAVCLPACTGGVGDICQEADGFLAACGASAPLLTDGPCAGLRAQVAECVLDNAATCRDLATLHESAGECGLALEAQDGLDDIPPPPQGTGGGQDNPLPDEATDDLCDDGLDNDDDGYIDCDDVGCAYADDVTVCDAAS